MRGSAWIPVSLLDIVATVQNIRTSPGRLMEFDTFNTSASVVYVKFYDALAANVTVGTTVPIRVVAIPATGGISKSWTDGLLCGTAISCCCTITAPLAGTTGPSSGTLPALNASHQVP